MIDDARQRQRRADLASQLNRQNAELRRAERRVNESIDRDVVARCERIIPRLKEKIISLDAELAALIRSMQAAAMPAPWHGTANIKF